jgi:hypothetical protein
MSDKHKSMLRSFVTTVLAVASALLLVSAVPGVAIPAAWVAVVTTVAGVARTLLAWLDKGMPLYGRGS